MNNGILTSGYASPLPPLDYGYLPPQMPLSTIPIRRVIPRVTTTQSGFGLTSPVVITSVVTNGFGLLNPPNTRNALGNHALSNVGTTVPNSWRSGAASFSTGPISTMILDFDFGRGYNITGFSFWNLGGTTTFADQGINLVTVQYKLGSGSWITLTTNFGVPSSLRRGTSVPIGTIPVQVIDFREWVYATNVRFINMSNFGGTATGVNNRIGFSEIQFFTFFQ